MRESVCPARWMLPAVLALSAAVPMAARAEGPTTQPVAGSTADRAGADQPPFRQDADAGDPADGVLLSGAATARSLAWRLYLPPRSAPPGKLGLVVWLHPNGRTMEEDLLEAYRAPLADADMALLVPLASDPKAWSSDDAVKVEATISAAIARCAAEAAGAIDPKGVVLFGDSAGGQVAFALVARSPDSYAGVVTINGYPMGVTPQGRRQVWAPPVEQKDRLRFFLLVGAQEGGRPLLRRLEALYRARGFWVTLMELSDGTGDLAAGQADLLARWMGDVAAGRMPDDPMADDRKRDVAARQRTADRVLKEMATLTRRRPGPEPIDPPTQAVEMPPWRVRLGAEWAAAGNPAPDQPARWQLTRGQGEQAQPVAHLLVSPFQANAGLDQYVKAHLLAADLLGGYAQVHHRGTFQVGDATVAALLLSEHRLRRRAGGTELEETTVFTWEALLPTADPKRFVGVAVQWEQGRLPIDAAAAVLTDVQRGLVHVGGGPTSRPEPPGVPAPEEIF